MESITATIGQKCANQETLAPNIKLGGATEKKVLDLCSLSSSLTRTARNRVKIPNLGILINS